MVLQFLRFNIVDFCVRQSNKIISVRDGEMKLGFKCRLIKAWKNFSGVGSGRKCRGHVSDKYEKQKKSFQKNKKIISDKEKL